MVCRASGGGVFCNIALAVADLPGQAGGGGGQHELPDAECHSHLQGRQGGPAGAYLCQGLQNQVPVLMHPPPRLGARVTYRDGRVAQLEHIYSMSGAPKSGNTGIGTPSF